MTMKITSTLIFFLMLFNIAKAQTIISGKIIDEKKQAVIGASVYLKGTYDGTSTDTTGFFKFKTDEKDTATLILSSIGFETIEQKIKLSQAVSLHIVLKESKNTSLKEVVITAGTFEASDTKRTTILKPLDIVTTAGASADVFGALQTLPGAGKVGEQEGLFVRGGSANETKAIVDGMIVQNPFFSSVPSVAQRGRFSPFMFKGTSFSTGGYSAQYGQGLSSVLILNTTDLAPKSQINMGLLMVGMFGGGVKKWNKTSLGVDVNYFNLGPVLNKVVKQNIDWQKAPNGYTGTVNFRHKTSTTGLLKIYGSFSSNSLGLQFPDVTKESLKTQFSLKNNNFYLNSTFNEKLNKWNLYAGLSQSYNHDDIYIDTITVNRADNRTQGRFVLNRDITENVAITIGSELHYYGFENAYQGKKLSFTDTYWANFIETDIYITPKLVSRIGLRNEYSTILNKWNIAPRMSFAYKTGTYSQVSLAYGQFFQNPNNLYLYSNHNLDFEKASHYILNYQIIKNDRTFRVEAYYKDYKSLVLEKTSGNFDADPNRFPSNLTTNSGYGYAKGIDVFYRDKKTFENLDFWISYSYLDTKRLFMNYTTEAMPTFASTHNLSIVTKKYFGTLHTQLNATYSLSSGRPYYNPNVIDFLSEKTPVYNNLSISINYLTNIKRNFAVIFAEIGNVLGTKNVFGYRYSTDGTQKIATNPPVYRSFMIGMFVTLDKFKKGI